MEDRRREMAAPGPWLGGRHKGATIVSSESDAQGDHRADGAEPRGSDRVAASLEQLIRRRTGGRIQDLRVEVSSQRIVLSGRCSTFYSKQLAQQAVLGAGRSEPVVNSIQVVLG